MIFNDVVVGMTSSDLVPLNRIELCARLGDRVDLNSEILNRYIQEYNSRVQYRYAYVRIPVDIVNRKCIFENEVVNSNSLSKILKDCKDVILLAVTAGIGVDKYITKISLQKVHESFYVDAIASAGIESYIEYVNNLICTDINVTKRFSPGYADFPLEFQTYLLNRLQAKENIGITLTDGKLMIPMKSITAVIGIK